MAHSAHHSAFHPLFMLTSSGMTWKIEHGFEVLAAPTGLCWMRSFGPVAQSWLASVWTDL